jgi:hypothetical protein
MIQVPYSPGWVDMVGLLAVDDETSLPPERSQLAPTSSSTLPPRSTWATASLMADKG